jgi:basic membrane lipoprotein Med (substrate-binding protein (PBP1-ABC) superfamily)
MPVMPETSHLPEGNRGWIGQQWQRFEAITQADYPETVVVSALWHFEPTLDAAIAAVKAGAFKADDYGQYSFMKAGGSSISALGTFADKVPADVKAKVAAKEADIKSGAFTVAIDDNEPKSS